MEDREKAARDVLYNHPDKSYALLFGDLMKTLSQVQKAPEDPQSLVSLANTVSQAILYVNSHVYESRMRLESLEKHFGVLHQNEEGERRFPPSGAEHGTLEIEHTDGSRHPAPSVLESLHLLDQRLTRLENEPS